MVAPSNTSSSRIEGAWRWLGHPIARLPRRMSSRLGASPADRAARGRCHRASPAAGRRRTSCYLLVLLDDVCVCAARGGGGGGGGDAPHVVTTTHTPKRVARAAASRTRRGKGGQRGWPARRAPDGGRPFGLGWRGARARMSRRHPNRSDGSQPPAPAQLPRRRRPSARRHPCARARVVLDSAAPPCVPAAISNV